MQIFYVLLSCFFFINIGIVFSQSGGQQNTQFDSIFYDTAVRKSASDIQKATQIADSLYNTSTTDLQRIKSLMLSADLLEKQSLREESIANALKAESIAVKIKNYEWQSRIYGFLSTQYRIVGLIGEGKRYLDKGLKTSDLITSQSRVDQYKGMVYQEMAHYAIYEKEFKTAIQLLYKANDLFSNMQNHNMKSFFYGSNEEMLGRGFLALNDFGDAQKHYLKALVYLDEANASQSQWSGMAYHGLGKIALENEEFEKSLNYLAKAETIAKAIDHTELKILIYRDLGKYYQLTGNLGKYSFYNKEHIKYIDKKISTARSATDKTVNQIYENQQADFNLLHRIILIISSLLLVSLGFYYITRNRTKRNEKRYKEIIADLNNTETNTIKTATAATIREESMMPQETEILLLQKLEEFEKKNQFTNPNLSLAVLSANFKTNTKYLSYVINTHKNKDFNNYINSLRIYYIVKIVRENPNYLNYKISYLSQVCGFSSHSKFATVFKSITGLTPSSFIDQVKSANTEVKVM